jgi:hypothetical protein
MHSGKEERAKDIYWENGNLSKTKCRQPKKKLKKAKKLAEKSANQKQNYRSGSI